MKVIARKGVRVPHERNAREYVTDDKAVDVPDTVYYQRRILDKDLILQDATAEAPADVDTVATGAKTTTKGA
ncbi:hypothetical protein WL94_20160 [Burkholderia cepacia]|uniref:DUF2635 domain-containing protein n=1 Tax=Burkholderia cepacia TaxID=292 RepID=UPI000756C470|nr:DUF2635 domain-containing protein [Burkholderia cepacia]KWF84983.1 hypothetical protein WL94_20160 [Burkholderia cepacia]